MKRKVLTRRRFVAAAASATMVTAPFARTAHAAGKLSVGFWDHWVPGANDASRALVEEWAAKEKVDVQLDYITSQGEKLRLTIAAESQARSGHDILLMGSWWPHAYANHLEPVDDLVSDLIKLNGSIDGSVTYLGRVQNRWVAVPATTGSQIKGPCSRIDLMKQYAGIDVQEMYPPEAPPKAENWTLETFFKAAEDCHKAGYAFGIGLGTTPDSVDTAGAIFRSFGAALVDANENITVKRCRPAGTRLLQAPCPVLPARCAVLGRCVQQQVAGGRQGCPHHEPTQRLGSGLARRTQDRRTTVDPWHACGTQGAVCALRPQLLGDLELQQEQVSGQELACALVPALGDREAGGGERGL